MTEFMLSLCQLSYPASSPSFSLSTHLNIQSRGQDLNLPLPAWGNDRRSARVEQRFDDHNVAGFLPVKIPDNNQQLENPTKSPITAGADASKPTKSNMPASLGSAIENFDAVIPTTMSLAGIPIA